MKYNKKTIDYFVNMEDANGWSHTSLRILQHVTEEVNENDPNKLDENFDNSYELQSQIFDKFQILTEQVEVKILKEMLGHEN